MNKYGAAKTFIDGMFKENKIVITDDRGKILSIENAHDYDMISVQQLNGILIPGFVNAHCHLELSYLRNQISARTGLPNFLIELLSKRFSLTNNKEEAQISADAEMYENGIVAVGDISNTIDSIEAKSFSKIYYHTFVETLGFSDAKAEKFFNDSLNILKTFQQNNMSASLVPHAPYSISRKLFSLLQTHIQKDKTLLSMHNEESIAELKFCENGSGDFNKLVEFLKYPKEIFQPYHQRSLKAVWNYINEAGKIILVHNTFSNEEDFKIISSKKENTFLCTCPNANLFIENILPDYDLWMKHTNNICIGTDSLASNNALSVYEEIKTILNSNKNISFETTLTWATMNGARALDLDNIYGSIAINKKPGLVLLESSSGFDINENNFITKRII